MSMVRQYSRVCGACMARMTAAGRACGDTLPRFDSLFLCRRCLHDVQ